MQEETNNIYTVEYLQDCGYAGMFLSTQVLANSKQHAAKIFAEEVRKQGYVCTSTERDIVSIIEE